MSDITYEEIRKKAEEFRETGNAVMDLLEGKGIDPFEALFVILPIAVSIENKLGCMGLIEFLIKKFRIALIYDKSYK
ncbi:MAG: hypothetical protein QXL52_01825 [Nitrososphaerales archaeon]